MKDTFDTGDAILFMKVGTHANEPLHKIIARKQQEIDDAGYAMWGYGGNTCHPRTMVQPFAASHISTGPIRLCMEPMNSKHFAAKVRAEEYSIDGITWEQIPEAINVVGSRFALCIRDLHEAAATLNLAETRVAVGRSKGRLGSVYVDGRVDKACLAIVDRGDNERLVEIGLVAEIVEPFAVFLRN